MDHSFFILEKVHSRYTFLPTQFKCINKLETNKQNLKILISHVNGSEIEPSYTLAHMH